MRAVLLVVLAWSPAPARCETVPELIVELPGPELLRPGEGQFDLHALGRRIGSGVFSNLASATAGAVEARWRRGISVGCEVALAGSFSEISATPVSTAFSPATPGMPVLSGAIKFRLPDRIYGWRVLFGTGASLINGRDKERFLPDDYARFNPTYVVLSRMLSEAWRGELVFKRNRVFANDRSDGTNLTTFDAALEFFASDQLSFQLEALSERLSNRTIGDYGTSTDTDGVFANLGVRYEFAPATSVQAYARGITRRSDTEVGLWWCTRL